MNNEKKIEELQIVCSRLLCGLNTDSLTLEYYYIFEDMIFNKDFELAYNLLIDKGHDGMGEINHKALLFVFENALREYKKLLK